MAWQRLDARDDGAFAGAATTLAHLDDQMKHLSKIGEGKSPFVGLTFPPQQGAYRYRFRLFLFAQYAEDAQAAQRACTAAMKAPDYHCLRDPMCLFFLELRPPSSAFQGQSVAIDGGDTIACRATLRGEPLRPSSEPLRDADASESPAIPEQPDTAESPPKEASECQDGEQRPCYDGPEGTAGRGICVQGQQRCEGGRWGDCQGQIKPQTEVCNGLDDDCDGNTDDLKSCSWVTAAGGDGDNFAYSVFATDEGDAFVTGIGLPLVSRFGDHALPTKKGIWNAFVARINRVKKWQWATGIDGPQARVTPWKITRAPGGGLYVAGLFQGTIQFGNSTITLSSPGKYQMFIASLSDGGTWRWAVMASANTSSYACDLLIGSDGTIYAAGVTSKTTVFGSKTETSEWNMNTFLAALSKDGQWKWVRLVQQQPSWLSISPQRCPNMAWGKGGDIIYAAYYVRQIKVGATTLPNGHAKTVLVASASTDGAWKWATAAATDSFAYPYGVAVNSKGLIAVGGEFGNGNQVASFGDHRLDPEGYPRGFVALLDPDKGWIEAFRVGDQNQNAHVSDVAFDAADNLYVSGGVSHAVTFGKHALTTKPWLSYFLAKRAPGGEWLWAFSGHAFPDPVDPKQFSYFSSLFVLPGGNYFMAGTTFASSFGPQTFTPASSRADVFVGYNIHAH